jgi:predicted dehydrogenase
MSRARPPLYSPAVPHGPLTTPVGVALLGYGYWGPNLARNVMTCDATRLEVICDADESARARAAKTYPHARVTADWTEVLEDPAVDAVMVALPVPLHHRFALEVLQAGRHVLVEKPLARTTAECDELAAAAEHAGRVLMVGHTFEYNAAVRLVRDLLRSGEMGEPYYVSMRRANLGIVRTDENAMWSLAPHDVSVLCHWLDRRPLSVNAVGVAHLQEGIEDVVFLAVKFEGGVLGHIHCSWLDPNKVREATIVGSAKMAVYDDVSPDAKVRVYDKGIVKRETTHPSLGRYEDFARFQMLARAGDVLIPKVEFREPLAVQIEHFAECVLEGRRPLTDAASGRRVVSVLEAAQRSLENDGRSEDVRLDVPVADPAA